MIGYLGIGYEFAAELTFQIPEGTSSGILNVTSELFGIIFTVIGGKLLSTYGDMVINLSLVGLLVVGFAMTMLGLWTASIQNYWLCTFLCNSIL
jgi:FLVCR family feline leukemia virus subgroup C receptor-related protein